MQSLPTVEERICNTSRGRDVEHHGAFCGISCSRSLRTRQWTSLTVSEVLVAASTHDDTGRVQGARKGCVHRILSARLIYIFLNSYPPVEPLPGNLITYKRLAFYDRGVRPNASYVNLGDRLVMAPSFHLHHSSRGRAVSATCLHR